MTSGQQVPRAIEEFHQQGYCVLRGHFQPALVTACREAFWPRLRAFLAGDPAPNRGPHRHYLPLPFEAGPAPRFIVDPDVLAIVRGIMDDRVVADQWGCDVPLRGSEYQGVHVDYRRPLFAEAPDLLLPPFAVVVSFGLIRIAREHGPIAIAPGTHRLPRTEGLRAVERGDVALREVPLDIGDALIRHPWALHRGTPNTTDMPRALVSIRYVRRWYADGSRDVEPIPRPMWESLTPDQREVLRFPVAD